MSPSLWRFIEHAQVPGDAFGDPAAAADALADALGEAVRPPLDVEVKASGTSMARHERLTTHVPRPRVALRSPRA